MDDDDLFAESVGLDECALYAFTPEVDHTTLPRADDSWFISYDMVELKRRRRDPAADLGYIMRAKRVDA